MMESMARMGTAPDLVFRPELARAAEERTANFGGRSRNACLHDLLENQTRKMAQSLHDEAGQLLAVVYLKLDEITDRLPAPQQGRVGDLRSELSRFESELRRLSHELRPMILDDFGVLPAVEFLRKGIIERTGIAISLRGSLNGRVAQRIETALYRITHELLRLACLGGARRVDVLFTRVNSRIECSIRQHGGDFSLLENAMAGIRQRLEDVSGSLLTFAGPDGSFATSIGIPLD